MHTEAEELELRLKVLAELNKDEDVSLQSLVPKYGIAYPKLLRWRKEFREAKVDNAVDKLVQLDTLVVNRVLDGVEQDAVLAAPGNTTAIEDTIDELRDGITGLRRLDTEVQKAALNLLARTNTLTKDTDLEPVDVQRLAAAVTSIQNAFFNKNGMHVQINNLQGDAMVSAFKGRLAN